MPSLHPTPHTATPRASLVQSPRVIPQPALAEQVFDVWYSGEPDVIEQHTAANEHNAKLAGWLKNPRREFWRYRARPAVAPYLQSLELA